MNVFEFASKSPIEQPFLCRDIDLFKFSAIFIKSSEKMITFSSSNNYYYFHSMWVFHTNFNWFSPKSERQQISSDLQDSSKYSSWS